MLDMLQTRCKSETVKARAFSEKQKYVVHQIKQIRMNDIEYV